MKGSTLTLALFLAAASVVGALAINAHVQARDEGLTNALAAAERGSAKPLGTTKPVASPAQQPQPTEQPKPAEQAKPTESPAASTPPPPVAAAADAEPPRVAFKQTTTFNGAPVYVPQGCSGQYDVILHFHGAHPYVREIAEKAGIVAVVGVFNAGNGAEKYSQSFQAGGTLSSLLRQITMAAAPLCPGASEKPRRVALTAWSAGYAAVEKLLSRPEDRERVDAALLADGLHAAFMDPYKRTFAPNALQAFRDFGELAKQNQKLLAITHSSIMTDAYGSTTECSKLLLEALDVPCESQLISGQMGSFSIEGSPGNDKAAHVVQFRQMDVKLLSKLRARWSP